MSAINNLRAVVFSKEKAFRQVMRAVLKEVGFIKVQMETEVHAARNTLLADSDAYLFLDWSIGIESAVGLLGTARSKFKIDNRPIMVFASQVSAQLVAVSHEYNASQIVLGDLVPSDIKTQVKHTLDLERPLQPLRRLLKQVGALRVKGDWIAATKILQDLYTQTKGNEGILVEYCENLAYENRWDMVENLLSRSINSQPPNPKAIHLFAKAKMQQGDFVEAEKVLRKAKIMNPENASRLIDLGEALFVNNKVDEAYSNFEQAARIDPESQGSAAGMGKCMLVQGDVEEGLALLRHSSSEAQIASVFNTSAIFCMRNRRFKEGMELYRKALGAVTENQTARSRLLFNTGLGFRRWRKPREALKYFEESFLLDQAFIKAQDFIRSTEKILIDSGVDPAFEEETVNPSQSADRSKIGQRRPKEPRVLDLASLEGAIEEIEDSYDKSDRNIFDFEDDEDFTDMDEINFV